MDTINNGVRAFELPAGSSLTLRQGAPGATALAALASADGPTGFTTAALTSATPVTIGPFTANARINIMAQGIVSVDSASGGGGSGTLASASDFASAALATGNTSVANALAGKQPAGTYATGTGTATGTNTGDQTLPVASSTTPAPLGVAAVGVGTTFARADHVHTQPTIASASDFSSAPLDTGNAPIAAALATKGSIGLATINGTDITAGRDIAASDFGVGVIRINSASALAITLPTVAAMALAATAGKARLIVFQILGGGIPTFAGKTSSTSINGTAGPTTVLPLGGAAMLTGGHYVLTQLSVGGDAWSLE